MAETTCCPAPKQQDPAESVAAAPALTVSSETKSRTTKKPEAILPISLRLIMEELLKLPEFSWEEIKKHTDAQSCWCVFHGLVYDLTKFLKLHPGGSHVILEVAGQDATDTFEDIGHTLEARIMADEYIVGRVKGETNLRRCKPENAKECSANAVRSSTCSNQ
ncbi:cytochrome b5, putative [Eimeria tenella]|uniref:Cytochrome b5, putative n=1 Tax=Eimeria tenella TaxID=5802 RepID=U6KVY3_EIMTE|nr:cytochrome b5, putative [Eimeria tenella]CDJ41083.1 cytochrome b5, putative [Eimeria tenella]|eukprot:XP_013231833.1 cytochrome b5, putative [Eimeria tenella]